MQVRKMRYALDGDRSRKQIFFKIRAHDEIIVLWAQICREAEIVRIRHYDRETQQRRCRFGVSSSYARKGVCICRPTENETAMKVDGQSHVGPRDTSRERGPRYMILRLRRFDTCLLCFWETSVARRKQVPWAAERAAWGRYHDNLGHVVHYCIACAHMS